MCFCTEWRIYDTRPQKVVYTKMVVVVVVGGGGRAGSIAPLDALGFNLFCFYDSFLKVLLNNLVKFPKIWGI